MPKQGDRTLLYFCDFQKCEFDRCAVSECIHTSDPNHALNKFKHPMIFEHLYGNLYVEVERGETNDSSE